MPWAVLGLGTNLGSRRAILESAIALLGPRVEARSRLYATPPLGPPQPDYLNAAVRVAWDDELERLLVLAQSIEARLGRERRVRWGPRTLDVDILHWSEGALETNTLRVPHPELLQRAFALAPLLDVAPEVAPEAALSALGGSPPLALPSWSSVLRGADTYGEWLYDEAELIAQAFALLSSHTSSPATHTLGTFEFAVPFAPLHGNWLEQLAGDAWRSGFAVRGGAVLSHDERGTRGVLLGLPSVYEPAPEPGLLTLEQRDDGARRWKVAHVGPASSWR